MWGFFSTGGIVQAVGNEKKKRARPQTAGFSLNGLETGSRTCGRPRKIQNIVNVPSGRHDSSEQQPEHSHDFRLLEPFPTGKGGCDIRPALNRPNESRKRPYFQRKSGTIQEKNKLSSHPSRLHITGITPRRLTAPFRLLPQPQPVTMLARRRLCSNLPQNK